MSSILLIAVFLESLSLLYMWVTTVLYACKNAWFYNCFCLGTSRSDILRDTFTVLLNPSLKKKTVVHISYFYSNKFGT
jgi:hypothetical protein